MPCPTFEGEMTALENLRTFGDRLEREIFRDGKFATKFKVYPSVWQSYVLPYRDPKKPRMIKGDWQQFAEHHYTTIMRCWTAFDAMQHIDSECETLSCKRNDAALLRLHGVELTFYAAMGSAWENLNDCFTSPPVRLGTEMDDGPDSDVYPIRNHFIHEVLVPIEDGDHGLVWFGTSLLKADNLHWSDAIDGSNDEVAEFHGKRWSEFVKTMNRRWSTLYDALKKVAPRTPQGFTPGLLGATSSPYR